MTGRLKEYTGRTWKIMKGHERLQKVMESHRRLSWKVIGGHEKSYYPPPLNYYEYQGFLQGGGAGG